MSDVIPDDAAAFQTCHCGAAVWTTDRDDAWYEALADFDVAHQDCVLDYDVVETPEATRPWDRLVEPRPHQPWEPVPSLPRRAGLDATVEVDPTERYDRAVARLAELLPYGVLLAQLAVASGGADVEVRWARHVDGRSSRELLAADRGGPIGRCLVEAVWQETAGRAADARAPRPLPSLVAWHGEHRDLVVLPVWDDAGRRPEPVWVDVDGGWL